MKVTYFYREPRKTGLSIEGIFQLVSSCLRNKVEITEFYCDAGKSRFQNILLARKSSGTVNHITGDVNFLALGLKGKNILTIHDLGHLETLKKRSAIQHLIYKLFWFKYPLRHIDIVTVVSEFTKNKLIQYFNFPEDRIRLIHDPIKPLFQFAPKGPLNSPPRILMMGTGKHKNLDNLIEATKGTNYHIDIIGWPAQDELDKLKNYNIPHTIVNGLSDEEVYEKYKTCDVLFMASHYEGFGMPIIEAQAVGRPVITSNIGAMKEVGGTSAVMVDPTKPEEIHAAMVKLAADRSYYDKIVAQGLENIKPYTHEIIAAQYLEVYRELAE